MEENLTTSYFFYLSSYLSLLFWYLFLSESKSVFLTSSALSLITISTLSLFECIIWSSSLSSLEEIKLIVIVNWIFHVSDCLRSFMMSLKYVLILSRYSSTDSILLYHCYFCIQYKYYSKNYLLLLVYSNFLLLLHTQKGS